MLGMSFHDWAQAIGAVATPAAVLIGVRQLRDNRKQAVTSFEDDLSREYRSISAELPAEAFYSDADGLAPLAPEYERAMLRYFDLSNEQLRLAREGRISQATSQVWEEGIRENMGLPIFDAAWLTVSRRLPNDFFTALDQMRSRQIGAAPADPATRGPEAATEKG